MTTEDYEPSEQLVKTTVGMLEQFLDGHVRDIEEQGEDWSGAHPISVEGDARNIIAAVRSHLLPEFYEGMADATEQCGPLTPNGLRALARLATTGEAK